MLYPENQKTPYVELVSVLVASLSMTVRSSKEKGHQTQARARKDS